MGGWSAWNKMTIESNERLRLLDLAKRSLLNGQIDAAEMFCQRLLAANTVDQEVGILLSAVRIARGQYRSAREIILELAASKQLQLATIGSLVAKLRGFAEYQAIDDLFEKLPRKEDLPVETLLALSPEASLHGDVARAGAYVKEALRRDPQHPPSMMSAAGLCLVQGDFEEAERYLDRTLAVDPLAPTVYWQLSKIRKVTPERNHIGKMSRVLRGARRLGSENTAMLYTALHKELDDVKDYDAAWQALERACISKRSMFAYSSADSIALVDALIASSHCLTTSSPNSVSAGVTPIFIVGMHRSGTTLMEQLLTVNPAVCAGGELYDFSCGLRFAADMPSSGPVSREIAQKINPTDLPAVGSGYLEKAMWRTRGKQFQTDKLPSNFLNIGYILHALPNARIIHMARDPMETCFSNLRELFSGVNLFSYRQDELAEYYLQYRRMMKHWNNQFVGRILNVEYSNLLNDTKSVMREVSEYCGISYIEEMSDPRNNRNSVSTASMVQVRSGITHAKTPKWKPYVDKLETLIQGLRDGGLSVAD